MPDESVMRAAMQAYIDRFNQCDGAGRITDMKAYHGPGDVRTDLSDG